MRASAVSLHGLFSGRPLALVLALSPVLLSCASAPPQAISDPVLPDGIVDRRGRFREVFCSIIDERGDTLNDFRPCDEALRRVGVEPEGSGAPVELNTSRRRLRAIFVPGMGWQCLAKWLRFHEPIEHLQRFGYHMTVLEMDGLSGTSTNARQIRDAMMARSDVQPENPVVLIAYSKGTADVLEAIVTYPELPPRISAVVSIAGAVGGSPVADEMQQSKLELLQKWPGATCDDGDGLGIQSLHTEVRRAWLDEHRLPQDLPFYSVITYPQEGRISLALHHTRKILNKVDRRNDGMLLIRDQYVPDSTLLAFVNADHWAVSVPVARSHPALASTFVTHNHYPREALFEAILRCVEEDLANATGNVDR